MARKWIEENYASVMRHYEFAAAPHQGVKGYEFYTGITRYLERHGAQGAIDDFVSLMPWGTPEQILGKFEHMRTMIDMNGLKGANTVFGYDVGDDMVVRLARLMAQVSGPEDQIARIRPCQAAVR
jgi:GGDEF domain-containing protein